MRKTLPETARLMLDALRTSFWFVPAAMLVASALLAFAASRLDALVETGRSLGWIDTADSARAILTTIAGSMITVAGVVFSITIVALSLASSQFGSRLLRAFMRDRFTQLVLGTFISTFLYCLLVLLFVRRRGGESSVPEVATALGVVLAVVSLVVLVAFIHHVSTSIQAEGVIASVVEELDEQLDRFVCAADREQEEPRSWPEIEGTGRPVASVADGYLLGVDLERLVGWARHRGAALEVETRPGRYVVVGDQLVRVHLPDPEGGERHEPNDAAVAFEEGELAELRSAFAFGSRRTAERDPLFPFEQLVEIALRALSPGINDPITAVACIHRLASALCRVAPHGLPADVHLDEHGVPRVLLRGPDFAELVASALDPLRGYGSNSAMVMDALLELLAAVEARTRTPARREVLAEHLAALLAAADRDLAHERDRRRLHERAAPLAHRLGGDAET
jgi:uncharacterized membrane protein